MPRLDNGALQQVMRSKGLENRSLQKQDAMHGYLAMIVKTLNDINVAVSNFSQTTLRCVGDRHWHAWRHTGNDRPRHSSRQYGVSDCPHQSGCSAHLVRQIHDCLGCSIQLGLLWPDLHSRVSNARVQLRHKILGGSNMETSMQAAVDELWTAYDTLWSSAGFHTSRALFWRHPDRDRRGFPDGGCHPCDRHFPDGIGIITRAGPRFHHRIIVPCYERSLSHPGPNSLSALS